MCNLIFAFRPMAHNVTYNFIADNLGGLQSWDVGRVVARDHFLETFSRACARRFTIIVAYRAENEHPLQIRSSSLTQKSERLQGPGIFHSRYHVISFAAGVVAGPLIRPVIQL